MFTKWFEEYLKILDGTRFISHLSTFLIFRNVVSVIKSATIK